MALLIEMYEQQYGVLTADITSKMGKLASTSGGRSSFNSILLEHIFQFQHQWVFNIDNVFEDF